MPWEGHRGCPLASCVERSCDGERPRRRVPTLSHPSSPVGWCRGGGERCGGLWGHCEMASDHGGPKPLHCHVQTTPAATSSPPQAGAGASPPALAPRRSPRSQTERGSPGEGLGGFGHRTPPGSEHQHGKASPNERIGSCGKGPETTRAPCALPPGCARRENKPGRRSAAECQVPPRTPGHAPAPCRRPGRHSLPETGPWVHTVQHLLPASRGYALPRN